MRSSMLKWTSPLLSVFLLVAALVLLRPPAAFAAQKTEKFSGWRVGTPFQGSMGVSRTMADIMSDEARNQSNPELPPTLGPEREITFRNGIRVNPESPQVASIPPMPADQLVYKPKGLPNQVMSPQTLGVNFTATNLAGTGAFPPDCDGAVGPTQYIVAVNGRMITFNKTTGVADGVLNATTNTFFTSVRNGSGTSDPMIRYDRLSNRWFVSIINVPSFTNRFLLAVSDAASNGVISAGTVWTYYFFIPASTAPPIPNAGGCFSDYPALGVDANAVYTSVDEFCGPTTATQNFQQTDAFVIRKSSVLNGGPIVVTAFRGLMTADANYVGPFAPRPADNYDPNSTEGYFIGTDGNSFGTFWLNRVSDPGGTPSLSPNIGITLPAYYAPRPVPHPSNSGGYWGRLDPLDDRPFHAHIRNQQLWTAHNVGINNTGTSNGTYLDATRVGARWYQFNVPVGAGAPTIVQSGTVFTQTAGNDSLQKNYFIPSISITGQGHAAMAYSTAGETDNANVGTVGRLVTDPAGTMESPIAITTSTFTYNPASDPGGISAGRPRRWGDYSITVVDPLDDMSSWTVQEFCDATNSYGVRVTRLLAPGPAAPTSAPDVLTGQSSVTVTLTGTSAVGTGFYDPGPNLPSPARPFSHVSAVVTNGAATGTPPTVTSVSYIDPTHLSVTLNTSAATANLPAEKYTITVTNPDGQTAAGAVIHVVAPTVTINASAGAGGTISPSGAVSVIVGSNQSFTITPNACFEIADVQVDGNSVGAVSSYTFTNVTANHTIAASFNAGISTPVTALAASQVKLGNDTDGTTKITLTFNAPPGAAAVEVWRKGYGDYPLYAAGSTPPAPGSYPPAGWTMTGVTASGQSDEPSSRDFWYYVAYAKNGCGDASPVSNVTSGTLDYHLGDVSDGVTPGSGNNTINSADLSLLGAHYGASGGALAGFEYLDVGPTTTFTTDGRPTPDALLDFEDLVLYSINFTPAVSVVGKLPPISAQAMNAVGVRSAGVVSVGETFDVPVELSGAGNLQGVSVGLRWNPAVVAPTGVSPGDLALSAGALVLSPGPGRVDAAALGQGHGLVGDGVLATVHFRVIADGDAGVSVGKAIGRDALNRAVPVTLNHSTLVQAAVSRTELHAPVPNPSRGGASLIQYSLARSGPVNLSVFSVDGRLVRTLANSVASPGRYQVVWDGADERGAPAKSGLFFIQLEAAGTRTSRLLTVIR